MTLTSRDRIIQREACPGCRQDRYNHPAPGDGWNAPVTSEKCLHLNTLPKYNHLAAAFRCGQNRERPPMVKCWRCKGKGHWQYRTKGIVGGWSKETVTCPNCHGQGKVDA